MKVWVDFTASAHPLVFRPLVERLQAQGHEVEITARQYAQTLQLIESHGMQATAIGHHGVVIRSRQRLVAARYGAATITGIASARNPLTRNAAPHAMPHAIITRYNCGCRLGAGTPGYSSPSSAPAPLIAR